MEIIYLFTHLLIYLINCSECLEYETPMYQELIICLFDNPFPISYYVNALFFKINRCFL